GLLAACASTRGSRLSSSVLSYSPVQVLMRGAMVPIISTGRVNTHGNQLDKRSRHQLRRHPLRNEHQRHHRFAGGTAEGAHYAAAEAALEARRARFRL